MPSTPRIVRLFSSLDFYFQLTVCLQLPTLNSQSGDSQTTAGPTYRSLSKTSSVFEIQGTKGTVSWFRNGTRTDHLHFFEDVVGVGPVPLGTTLSGRFRGSRRPLLPSSPKATEGVLEDIRVEFFSSFG